MIELLIAVAGLVISSFHAVEAKMARDDQNRFFCHQRMIYRRLLKHMGSIDKLLQLEEKLRENGDDEGAAKVQELMDVFYCSEESHRKIGYYLRSEDFCDGLKQRYSDLPPDYFRNN
ncbi:MAG: hypothetical protein H6Q73_3556 [Firmicutes bacterium]|nr:hypothetical protein [Bacillota bacterium]